ncbi:hypothetical protein BC833DRAFT_651416 [Globomyces pollinis-pini]|nr:hypothetical protein BC833DRAFT_651416 [Globomyces pollinis-pini]
MENGPTNIRTYAGCQDNIVTPNTRSEYFNKSSKFILHIIEKHPELITSNFNEYITELPQILHKHIKNWLEDADRACPINLQGVTSQIVIEYLCGLTKTDGQPVGYSVCNSTRAAIRFLFTKYRVRMDQLLIQELQADFKGLKRIITTEEQNEERLDFGLYRIFCRRLLCSGFKDYAFAHCSLVLCWNLMCGVSNGLGLKLNHLNWSADSLQVFFSQTKSNKISDIPRDPKHIYANPYMPEICPILALGVYLLSIELSEESDSAPLFPGTKQYDRYRKILEKLYTEEDIKCEIENRGLTSSDLGTHSCRKGATTYCSTGIIGGPHPASINLRAGWTQEGLKDRNLKYEIAGDQFLGRTVTGLPVCDAEFSVLPPYFEDACTNVSDCIDACFPNLPICMRRVADFGLASVVYHAMHTPTFFPTNHFVYSTPLFTSDYFDRLKPYVRCHLPTTNDPIQATGLPEHIRYQLRMNTLQQKIDDVATTIATLPERTIQGVTQILEERAVDSGTVTYNGLKEILTDVISQQNQTIEDLLLQLRNSANPQAIHQSPIQNIQPSSVQQRLASLPADFEFPKCPPLQAWQLWCCGNVSLGYPPFRSFKPHDLPSKNLRKRLSDLRFLMGKVEKAVQTANQFIANPSLEEANSMYEIGKFAISIPEFTEKNRKRRQPQLTWGYVAQKVRKQ